ncbi:MAG: molybdenum cofactor biosynthesis protein MoaE [Ignavibacteriaceae bacterium]|nr:molybdenum cofactor biosynthesis protein MoaE [Ignavibacteriaceae bacterium]
MSTSSLRLAEDKFEFITYEPIDITKMIHTAQHPGAGGVVLFCGNVRNNQAGRPVKYLVYESYSPLADKMIKDIIQTAVQNWDLLYASSIHRIGKIHISDCAVAVVTAHTHRKEAYAANQYIIDRIKHEVPVWKCEFFEDGTHEWGQNC